MICKDKYSVTRLHNGQTNEDRHITRTMTRMRCPVRVLLLITVQSKQAVYFQAINVLYSGFRCSGKEEF
jgi:hypothetical protein